jgi:hypothetical protein
MGWTLSKFQREFAVDVGKAGKFDYALYLANSIPDSDWAGRVDRAIALCDLATMLARASDRRLQFTLRAAFAAIGVTPVERRRLANAVMASPSDQFHQLWSPAAEVRGSASLVQALRELAAACVQVEDKGARAVFEEGLKLLQSGQCEFDSELVNALLESGETKDQVRDDEAVILVAEAQGLLRSIRNDWGATPEDWSRLERLFLVSVRLHQQGDSQGRALLEETLELIYSLQGRSDGKLSDLPFSNAAMVELALSLARIGDARALSILRAEAAKIPRIRGEDTQQESRKCVADGYARIGRFNDALSTFASEGLNEFLQVLFKWSSSNGFTDPCPLASLVTETTRIAGWTDLKWQGIHERLSGSLSSAAQRSLGWTDPTDELLPSVRALTLERGQVSIPMLQRHFRVGYVRAQRLVRVMQAELVIDVQADAKGVWKVIDRETCAREMC